MKDILNAKVKHREGFRPFAPSVLLEKAPDYFDLACEQPLYAPHCRGEEGEAAPCSRYHAADVLMSPASFTAVRGTGG